MSEKIKYYNLKLGKEFLEEAAKAFRCKNKKKGCYLLEKAAYHLKAAYHELCRCDNYCDPCPYDKEKYDKDRCYDRPYRYDKDKRDKKRYDKDKYDRDKYDRYDY